MENAETDCREVLKRLYLYLDGEMAGAGCAEIERHLQACGYCLGQVDFERELKAVVRRKCGERLPQGMVERVRERLRLIVEGP